MHNVGQDGGTADADIDAPEAWSITTGSTQVVVSEIDSGVDDTHPDLYLNIWLNNAEIPAPLRARLTDTDADGRFTFRDLNATTNSSVVVDLNHTGTIDAGDLQQTFVRFGSQPAFGGIAPGVSPVLRGYA